MLTLLFLSFTDRNSSMGANSLLGRLLHILLRLPSPLRASHPLHLSSRPQRPLVQSNEDCPDQPTEALQGKPEVRMQETERLQLHHIDAHSCRNSFPDG